jgi:hypothetical protein
MGIIRIVFLCVGLILIMKLVWALLLVCGIYSVTGSPAVSKNRQHGIRARPATKVVTQGGEDPDPEIQIRREFVKQVRTRAYCPAIVSIQS